MSQFKIAVSIAEDAFEGKTYGKSQRPMMEHLLGVVAHDDRLRRRGHGQPGQRGEQTPLQRRMDPRGHDSASANPPPLSTGPLRLTGRLA